ncbi:8e435543-4ae8-4c9e-aa54-57025456b147 [Sclerotinia trifoliorum]|uniref:8e435543-4ae8-4c9e-aa54-57025456b147 n=1 Tax=Sclerotinia trifoliorum TaxID=28548 RepID=A0A8H2VN55_9HELO|nr:8e435543-4ae8-4c9e-aa54-57025456b147 [Sclerotinia trifoliorum]
MMVKEKTRNKVSDKKDSSLLSALGKGCHEHERPSVYVAPGNSSILFNERKRESHKDREHVTDGINFIIHL